jgi:hypothetical protein
MRYLLACFGLVSLHFSYGQDSSLVYSAQIQGSFTPTQVPFWLYANQAGAYPIHGSYARLQLSAYKEYRPSKPQTALDWSAGAELVSYAGTQSAFFLTDIYAAARWSGLEVSVGQRKSSVGLMDTTLTSGSLSLSSNYRPYPKVQLSVPAYIPLGFTKNYLALKGSYSDGLMGESAIRYGNTSQIPQTYLHHKAFYVRLGAPLNRIHLYGGFNHQVMWGGENRIFTGGLAPRDAYYYAIIGKGWAGSRVGNHFGTIDLGMEWKTKNWTYFAYRQTIYEDGSLLQLANAVDGLNGLSIRRRNSAKTTSLRITALLAELIYTKRQGGSIFDYQNRIFGIDNYYNHYVYLQGWSYNGYTLGTPLLPPQDLLKDDLPRRDSLFTTNNRIQGFHLGVEGQAFSTFFQTRLTFTQNFGTYRRPIHPLRNQLSIYLKVERPFEAIKNSFLTLELASDLGKLYPNSGGIRLGWYKRGYF